MTKEEREKYTSKIKELSKDLTTYIENGQTYIVQDEAWERWSAVVNEYEAKGGLVRRGRKKGWAKRGEKGGRPIGSVKEGSKGRLKPYKTFSVSCPLDEYERVKAKAEEQNKTISRYLLDAVKDPK